MLNPFLTDLSFQQYDMAKSKQIVLLHSKKSCCNDYSPMQMLSSYHNYTRYLGIHTLANREKYTPSCSYIKSQVLHSHPLTLLHSKWPKLHKVSGHSECYRVKVLTLLHSEWAKLHRVSGHSECYRVKVLTLLHSEWAKLQSFWPL